MATGGAEPRSSPKRIVVFDGGCLLCLRTMACLDELDTGSRLGFVDGRGGPEHLPEAVRRRGIDVMHAMCVVEEGGAVLSGFHAFRSIALALPVLWPIVPLLYAPGARVVGPRIYAAVARRRSTCALGGCAIATEVPAATPD
jgi:predicted DCC family thiol-disulfide oxidoreductase YuxK